VTAPRAQHVVQLQPCTRSRPKDIIARVTDGSTRGVELARALRQPSSAVRPRHGRRSLDHDRDCTADRAGAHGASWQQQHAEQNSAARTITVSTRGARPRPRGCSGPSQPRKRKSDARMGGCDGGSRRRRQSRARGSATRAELFVRAACAALASDAARRPISKQTEDGKLRTLKRVVWAHMRARARESQWERSCRRQRARGRV
jgi:hypothetical protein